MILLLMKSYLYKRTKQLLKRLPLSIGHAWCMALQLLFEQNLTLISTEIKITGVIRYNKSSCPWPGCLLQSKRGLPQSSHSVLDGIKHWGTSLKLWHAESIFWGTGYGITLLMFSLIVDPLLTLTSCSAVTVVDVAELDSPDVDGDTVFTRPESEDIFKTQKRICRWGQMVPIFNCLLLLLFFAQLLFVQWKSPSLFCTWQYPMGLDGPWEAPWYPAFITTLRNFNSMPKIVRMLNSIDQHSLCCVITFVIFYVIFM